MVVELCRVCSLETGGCCRVPDPLTPGFPLSGPELERLAAHTHLTAPADPPEAPVDPLKRVAMSAPNSPEFLAAMGVLLPRHKRDIAALFPEGGTYCKLRLDPAGHCVFRGENGCRLPHEVRPWYCRLFPLWMQGGSVVLMHPEGCRLRDVAGTPLEAMRLLGLRAPEVSLLFEALLRDWSLKI